MIRTFKSAVISLSLLTVVGATPAAAQYRQIDLTIFGMD